MHYVSPFRLCFAYKVMVNLSVYKLFLPKPADVYTVGQLDQFCV